MYLVVECRTTSAPSASGDCRYGEANVLSTTSRAPAASRATSATAAMSAMPSSGLVGVSHQITRVSGRSAARSAADVGEVDRGVLDAPRPEHLVDQPERAAVGVVRDDDVVARRQQHAQQHVGGAHPRPERDGVPPALQRGEALLQRGAGGVGASGSTRSPTAVPPTPSCAYVDDGWIGGITAPVVGSGSWPAWIALVEKPCMRQRYADRRPGRVPRTWRGARRGSRARPDRVDHARGLAVDQHQRGVGLGERAHRRVERLARADGRQRRRHVLGRAGRRAARGR